MQLSSLAELAETRTFIQSTPGLTDYVEKGCLCTVSWTTGRLSLITVRKAVSVRGLDGRQTVTDHCEEGCLCTVGWTAGRLSLITVRKAVSELWVGRQADCH